MRGISRWDCHPYRPFHLVSDGQKPFVVRIAPSETGFEAEFIDNEGAGEAHTVYLKAPDGAVTEKALEAGVFTFAFDGLERDTDHEFWVERNDGATGLHRLVRTGEVPGARNGAPGTVVNYLHPEDTVYSFSGRALCSPSIVKLEDGALLASMDVYAFEAPQNLSLIFRSDDGGAHWRYMCDLFPCFWGTLFTHKGRLFMQCCSTEYGDILIGESKDGGRTWSAPVRLFAGSCSNKRAGWQRTPMPMIYHNHRLWVSADYGAWKEGGHYISALSIDVDDEPLIAENWAASEPVKFDEGWQGAPVGKSGGLLEGSIVVSREGKLIDILRLGAGGCVPDRGIACALEVNPNGPEAPLSFHGFINIPSGSNSKTHILYDPVSDGYWAIGNVSMDPNRCFVRNVAALQFSRDLYEWRIVKLLLDYREEPPEEVGFQYIYFLFDGDDLIWLSRTALNRAANFHDANYSMFHRERNFRSLL